MTILSSFFALVLAVSVVYPLGDNSALYRLRGLELRERPLGRDSSNNDERGLARYPESSLRIWDISLCSQLLIGQSFVKGRENEAASLTEPLEHKPRRLLSNAYFFAELERRDALSSGNKQIHRINPLVKRNVRTLEDRASANREIQFAGVTAVVTAFPRRDAFTDLTSRTNHAVRPQTGFEIKPSGFLIGNRLEQLKSAYCAFAHKLNIPKRSEGVKYIIP